MPAYNSHSCHRKNNCWATQTNHVHWDWWWSMIERWVCELQSSVCHVSGCCFQLLRSRYEVSMATTIKITVGENVCIALCLPDLTGKSLGGTGEHSMLVVHGEILACNYCMPILSTNIWLSQSLWTGGTMIQKEVLMDFWDWEYMTSMDILIQITKLRFLCHGR